MLGQRSPEDLRRVVGTPVELWKMANDDDDDDGVGLFAFAGVLYPLPHRIAMLMYSLIIDCIVLELFHPKCPLSSSNWTHEV